MVRKLINEAISPVSSYNELQLLHHWDKLLLLGADVFMSSVSLLIHLFVKICGLMARIRRGLVFTPYMVTSTEIHLGTATFVTTAPNRSLWRKQMVKLPV